MSAVTGNVVVAGTGGEMDGCGEILKGGSQH